MKKWKLFIDWQPLKGSLNMAIDEYLFLSLDEQPQTYVRFYQWEKPTASLGYSQRTSNVVNLKFCQEQGIDIVRRITGGKLVLHHKEITYSICSSDANTFGSTLQTSYRQISQALIRGLEKMGLEPALASVPPASYTKGNLPCFSYPAANEIEVAGKKIVGSAQKRIGSRFLQHGSIPLEQEEELLKSVSFMDTGEDKIQMTSLSQVLVRSGSFDWAVPKLAKGIAEFFGVLLEPWGFSEKEREHILKIQRKRYESKDWTFGGRSLGQVDFFNL